MGRFSALGRWFRTAPVLALLVLCLGTDGALAGNAVNTGQGDVAIQGYDPVAYFTEARPVKGSSEFSQSWLGVTWLFASAEHRDIFTADPIRYVPQYGGFCAGSVANGDPHDINPESWRIIDGKLYLFGWQPDELPAEFDSRSADVIARANENWPEIEAKLKDE
jgi:YHS domain-containing protein